MHNRLFISLISICLLFTMGLSCGKNETPKGATESLSKTVGASLLTQTHVFYQDLADAMRETAVKNGLNLRIQYAEFDPRKQNDQIEMFILQRVDALIISPTDSSGIGPLIKEAMNKKIPVFTVDITAKDADVVCHIASDNYQGGYMLGKFLADKLEGKGKIAIIDHPTVTSVQERVKGFEDAIKEYPGIEVVQKVPGDGQRDKAMRATQDLIASRPDLDAIFGINDDSALGALAGVESAGLQNRIKIVGFDATPEACNAILEGKCLIADIAQYPREIGKSAIETVSDYFKAKEIPKVRQIPVKLITRETLLQERSNQNAKS
ncbi:MAG: substrate-binding domain-containing protein [Candidatus Hydrogenedentes bacterium]|nr:substrate-binding domain-containing protein [Candidatus Hydrogenedentota bacterium]